MLAAAMALLADPRYLKFAPMFQRQRPAPAARRVRSTWWSRQEHAKPASFSGREREVVQAAADKRERRARRDYRNAVRMGLA